MFVNAIAIVDTLVFFLFLDKYDGLKRHFDKAEYYMYELENHRQAHSFIFN